MKFHDWLYSIVDDVCHDRDYLYFCFARHFTRLTTNIFEQGRFAESGTYEIPGMKSGKKAQLFWRLEHGIDLMRRNSVAIHWTVENSHTGKTESEGRAAFELSCGERVPD